MTRLGWRSLGSIAMVLLWSELQAATPLDRTLREAFERGQAKLLENALPSNEKILIEAAAFGITRQHYSREQCLKQLETLFSGFQTVRFELRPSNRAERRHADWTIRRKATGRLEYATVHIEIATVENAPAIVSIRIAATSPPFRKRTD